MAPPTAEEPGGQGTLSAARATRPPVLEDGPTVAAERLHLHHHGLLPQPGGFEGLIAVAVSLASHDKAIAQCPQMPDANVESRAAGGAAPPHVHEDEDLVVGLPEALRFRAKLIEHLGPIREEPNDVLAAPDRLL